MKHISVLTKEVIKYLAPQKNENFIDATCGLGGHAKLILEKNAPKGRLLAIDQDWEALEKAKLNLKKFRGRIDFAERNFQDLGLLIRDWPYRVDGILFDLGVSSLQLGSQTRGFSFQVDSPLDMRMAPERQRLTAAVIVNRWPEKKLKEIFEKLGEEPYAGKIAKEIVLSRNREIKTTLQLVEIIRRALPKKYLSKQKMHFATSIFRALRMAVNDELKVLESGLKQAEQILASNGRIVVISFHSLEDRIVKDFFRENPNLKVLTPKPIIPAQEEIHENPRARSAKLRAAMKLEIL